MEKFYHVMILPVFGEVDGDFILNVITILAFSAIYLWHVKHDHKHNEELLEEVKKIREEITKRLP